MFSRSYSQYYLLKSPGFFTYRLTLSTLWKKAQYLIYFFHVHKKLCAFLFPVCVFSSE